MMYSVIEFLGFLALYFSYLLPDSFLCTCLTADDNALVSYLLRSEARRKIWHRRRLSLCY